MAFPGFQKSRVAIAFLAFLTTRGLSFNPFAYIE